MGDAHGRLAAMTGNMRSLNLIDDNGNWSGEDSIFVMTGDVWCDRYAEGSKIMDEKDRLKAQANAENGTIIALAGNHDDWPIAYLTNSLDSSGRTGADAMTQCVLNDYVGYKEFSNFGNTGFQETLSQLKQAYDQASDHEKPGIASQILKSWKEEHETIIRNMRSKPEGQKILDQLSSMDLLVQVDDMVYLHTVPNETILRQIAKRGPKNLNDRYKELCKRALNGETLSPADLNWFTSARRIFLNTNNVNLIPDDQVEQMKSDLKGHGINGFIFGHSINRRGITEKHNLVFLGIDTNAFQGTDNARRAICTIDQRGGIQASLAFTASEMNAGKIITLRS